MFDENSGRTVPGVRHRRQFDMRRCRGMPCAAGARASYRSRQRIPVRAGERHRRLPADVGSPLAAIILGAINGFQLKGIERAADRLQSLHGYTQILGGGSDVGVPE